jgi:hypothetical protein
LLHVDLGGKAHHRSLDGPVERRVDLLAVGVAQVDHRLHGRGHKVRPHRELLGKRALQRRAELVVGVAKVEVLLLHVANEARDLLDREHALEEAHADHIADVAPGVPVLDGRRHNVALHVVVHHGARDQRPLVRQTHERELVVHQGEKLVQVELDARELREARDVDARHALGERAVGNARALGTLRVLLVRHSAPSRKHLNSV